MRVVTEEFPENYLNLIVPQLATGNTLTTGDTVYTSYSPSPAQTCKNTPLTITLSGSDSCGENSLTFSYAVTRNPTNGSLSGTVPNLTYTPTNASFTGVDSFIYKVSTVCGNSVTNTDRKS